ncbi:hypothetical protein QS413_12805 [Staphylococcus pseudintermedius]|uniref:hypothetical protein n=1 Tax=Staphylococcus pseudintermedius TaxID=283734 RepID=UPI00286DC354|nr:hypothetical protein [Staphylococcus pseudintermedius]WMZ50341.1 hypothetical protein QS413_12805 [Staphylococcus pseudintermedius]
MLNDADSLSDTDVDFDALSESLVDVLVDLLNDAESLSDTSPVINYVSRHLTTSDNFLFQAFKRLSLGFAW